MKKIILTIFLLNYGNLLAQDGTDIEYVKASKLDISFVGKIVHLDFYNWSFGCSDFKVECETVIIEIDGKKIEFKEHRVDNGFNNWLSQQYLESTEFIDDYKIRIVKCEILKVTSDLIEVALFLQYNDKSEKTQQVQPQIVVYSFSKVMLNEILIKH